MSLKSKVEHLIKFNPVVNGAFSMFAGLGVACLGFRSSINNNLILFVSDAGKNYTGSPRALYEYMSDQNLLSDMEVVWAFERPEEYEYIDCKKVKLDSCEYFRIAQQARFWISDVNIERGLKFKRQKTIYLNTWHGTSFKTLGWDIHDRIYYDCSSIDLMCVSSEYDAKTFSSAFRIKKDCFLPVGLPRNDQLYLHRDEESADWKKRVGLPTDKKVILYAPTWRDTTDGGSTYSIKPPVDFTKWREKLGDEYVLAFRMHPLTSEALGIEPSSFLFNYSHFQPLNDLLLASDVLITDYSSIAFDYAILGRPALCFGYDASEYERARGFYLDIDKVFPRGNCATEEILLEEIEQIDYWGNGDYCAPLYKVYNTFGGKACEQCCEVLFGYGNA